MDVDGIAVKWSPTPGVPDLNSTQRLPGTLRVSRWIGQYGLDLVHIAVVISLESVVQSTGKKLIIGIGSSGARGATPPPPLDFRG